jgi:hypothetical protein
MTIFYVTFRINGKTDGHGILAQFLQFTFSQTGTRYPPLFQIPLKVWRCAFARSTAFSHVCCLTYKGK